MHEVDRLLARHGREAAGDARGERVREAVVAEPVLEEVTEDVERFGLARRALQEALEPFDDRRARFVEMQVRDEERLLQARSAFSITTASRGTFWCPPASPVATFLILSTVSLPSTTLPKTA